MTKKENPITKVVRDAMKAVSKNVRVPKVVRNKIVKEKQPEPPSYRPLIVQNNWRDIDYILLDDSIKLKSKHILNAPVFSQRREVVEIWGEYEPGCELPTRNTLEDVEVKINVGNKKMGKIMELFHQQQRIHFTMALKNETRIISTGYLSSISNWPEEFCFTYTPNEFILI